MRRVSSTVVFLVLTTTYLLASDAPVRVHLLSVLCFAIAFWLPALVAPTIEDLRRRWVACAALALSGMLLWDGAKHQVVFKTEPFDMLRYATWTYGLGLAVLGALLYLNAWVGELARWTNRHPQRSR